MTSSAISLLFLSSCLVMWQDGVKWYIHVGIEDSFSRSKVNSDGVIGVRVVALNGITYDEVITLS